MTPLPWAMTTLLSLELETKKQVALDTSTISWNYYLDRIWGKDIQARYKVRTNGTKAGKQIRVKTKLLTSD